jgi:hypothetical protein
MTKDKINAYNRKWRLKRKENGLCIVCGSKAYIYPNDIRATRCEFHLQVLRDTVKRCYQKRKLALTLTSQQQ